MGWNSYRVARGYRLYASASLNGTVECSRLYIARVRTRAEQHASMPGRAHTLDVFVSFMISTSSLQLRTRTMQLLLLSHITIRLARLATPHPCHRTPRGVLSHHPLTWSHSPVAPWQLIWPSCVEVALPTRVLWLPHGRRRSKALECKL